MLVEASLVPASSGFGLYHVRECANVDYVQDLTGFQTFMSRQYDWRWAHELNGMICHQNNGKPFKWRELDSDGPWTYGIIFEESDDNEN